MAEKKIRERILKDGNVHFYSGRNKISDKEKKEFFKSQIGKVSFEPDRLSPEDRKLFGRIKGGVAAAAKAVRLSNGQVVKRDIAKAAKKLGVNLEEALKQYGFKSLKELEEKKPEFFKQLLDYLESGIVTNWYNPEAAKITISDYRGKEIYLNGNKVSKGTAKNAISTFNQEILNIFKEDGYMSGVRIEMQGFERLSLNIPDINEIPKNISTGVFNDLYGHPLTGMWQIYGSPIKSN